MINYQKSKFIEKKEKPFNIIEEYRNNYKRRIYDAMEILTCPNCWENTENWICTNWEEFDWIIACGYWSGDKYYKKDKNLNLEKKWIKQNHQDYKEIIDDRRKKLENTERCWECWNYAKRGWLCNDCYTRNKVRWNY